MNSSYYFTKIGAFPQNKEAKILVSHQFMNFNFTRENLYLITDTDPIISYFLLKNFIFEGYKGVLISQKKEDEFLDDIENEIFLEGTGEISHEAIPSNFYTKAKSILNKLSNLNFIFIEKLEILISKNGFEDRLKFIYNLRELAHLKSLIILISVDSSTIKPRYIRLLEKESKLIELELRAKT
ncbi:MAG: DUF835 domain-containing protein [Candidatus Hodarchaeales archaeon]|jgi:hypothetical protein